MIGLVVVAVLIACNGFFSLAEFAIANARNPRLLAMSEAGRRGARTAFTLAEDPSRFLSTVQIGITLISVLTGIATGWLAGNGLSGVLESAGLPKSAAVPVAYGTIVAAITYFSVVIGELVPKRLALRAPETIACLVAPFMNVLSNLLSPAVWMLGALTDAIVAALKIDAPAEDGVSDHEIHSVVAEAEQAGVIDTAERLMISGVMRLGDRSVRGVMTPRTDLVWLDLSADRQTIEDLVVSTKHAYLPVSEGSIDAMFGVVSVGDVLRTLLKSHVLDIRAHVFNAPRVADTAQALEALAVLRKADVPIALVHDEHGHFAGLATPADMLEAIAGVFRADAEDEPADPTPATARPSPPTDVRRATIT